MKEQLNLLITRFGKGMINKGQLISELNKINNQISRTSKSKTVDNWLASKLTLIASTEDKNQIIANVSPRGRKRERIIWFIKDNIIHICEQALHEGDYRKLARKLKTRIISYLDYTGWRPLKPNLDY